MEQTTPEPTPTRHTLQHELTRRRRLLLRQRRQPQMLRAAATGALAGLAAVAFQLALRQGDRTREALAAAAKGHGFGGFLLLLIFCAGLAGCAGWLTSRFAPEASGSGIPHAKAVLLNLRTLRWLRVLVVKFIGGTLALTAGLSLGREGPTVQMGAAAGAGLAEHLKLPGRWRQTLIACGAGAGLTGAFNAPLAGFLFVLEEMQRELSPLTYSAALIATVVSDAVTRLCIGQQPSFRITGYPTPPMKALPLAALLGIAAGLMGVAFNRVLLGTVRAARRSGIPSLWRAMAAGALAAVLVWYVPAITGSGHRTAELVMSGRFTGEGGASVLLLMTAAKLLFTACCYATGTPGGIFAPLLAMGAFLGLGFGLALNAPLTAMGTSPAAFAVIGMAAMFSGVVRTPLTGIVLIVEMTGNYAQLYALIVASLTAYLVAEALHDRPIYDALMEEDLRAGGSQPSPGQEPVMVDLLVEPGAFMDGRAIKDLKLPPGCLVVSLIRRRRQVIPTGSTMVQAGDMVSFLVDRKDALLPHTLAQAARMDG